MSVQSDHQSGLSRWIVRNVGPWIVVWAVLAYVFIALLELLVFGRFEPTEYIPSAIGLGIGLAFAQRVVSFPPTASTES